MDEYIEREKLLRDINHYHLSDGKFQHWVEVQPAAEVAPVVHGRWENSTDEWFGTDVYTCSKCRELCACGGNAKGKFVALLPKLRGEDGRVDYK